MEMRNQIQRSPLIPRFKQNKCGNSGSKIGIRSPQQVSFTQKYKHEWTSTVYGRKIVGKQRSGRMQQKQNLSPLLFDFHNSQLQKKNCKKLQKRPLTHIYPQNENSHTASIQISEFNAPQLQIDSYCSKITHSILVDKKKENSLSFDDFEKIKRLGSGKYGEVFLVKHKNTGFLCAIKAINKEVIRQQKLEHQIAREIRIQNILEGKSVIGLYGFFDDHTHFYIIMEFAEGGSVFNQLKGKTRLQESVIPPIIRGVCQGINFIHKMGYVHRDIKPDNVVLQFNMPKICDFGWAINCKGETCSSYCGTPLYISPQMIKKEEYGKGVDVWALGVLAYELLVGRIPFRIWSQRDMGQILQKQVQFPQYIDRSPQCEDFILRCLNKSKRERISAQQALQHQFLKGRTHCSNFSYQFYEESKLCLE